MDGIVRDVEQKMVKPLDSTFGEWTSNNFKVEIKNLDGFKRVAAWFTKKLADDLDQRAHQRKMISEGAAPPEHLEHIWKSVENLYNAKIDALEKVPKEVTNYLYIRMGISMIKLYYKLLTTDTADPNKQVKALLDETKTMFEEIKKKVGKK
jgi:hypothetical protein